VPKDVLRGIQNLCWTEPPASGIRCSILHMPRSLIAIEIEALSLKAKSDQVDLIMRLSDYIGRYWASAEVMYAVIIAMTFTSTLRGHVALIETFYSTIVYSALFCCIAWGIADGLFYAWERSYNIKTENRIIEYSRSPEGSVEAISLIRDELDDTILRNVNEKNRGELYQKLVKHLSEVGTKGKLSLKDILSIVLGTSIASTIAGLFIVAPFFLMDNLTAALDISNLVGICLLFGIGYYRAHDRNLFTKVVMGFGTAIIGIVIAVITTFLGG
jgi:VIT1/CCC1 family predicted Fe2+/Mn2+ transporter